MLIHEIREFGFQCIDIGSGDQFQVVIILHPAGPLHIIPSILIAAGKRNQGTELQVGIRRWCLNHTCDDQVIPVIPADRLSQWIIISEDPQRSLFAEDHRVRICQCGIRVS